MRLKDPSANRIVARSEDGVQGPGSPSIDGKYTLSIAEDMYRSSLGTYSENQPTSNSNYILVPVHLRTFALQGGICHCLMS